MDDLDDLARGPHCRIKVLQEAATELDDLLDGANRQRMSELTGLLNRIQKYAECGELHRPDQLNNEGGGFEAFKKDQARAYFWRVDGCPNRTCIVCHFCVKKTQKRTKAVLRLLQNRRDKLQGESQ